MMAETKYTEESIRSLDWKEHIRYRPGMYIGKLGDGSSPDDGIYVLLKEVIDNAIDEFTMGYGKTIDVIIKDKTVTVRDYGRGIPLGKVLDCVAKINTGAKYDSEVFKKAVGLNGVGTKAVNALSTAFRVQSIREGKTKIIDFRKGDVEKNHNISSCQDDEGTIISFTADETIFHNYHYLTEHVEKMLWNYAFLNTGLRLKFNGQKIESEKGLYDLLERNLNGPVLYPIIHLKGADIEVAMTHSVQQYSEEYYSFVNGQHTTQGGSHLNAFREAVVKTIREFYKKNFEAADIRKSIVAAVSIKVQEPVFESQTKTKLGSQEMSPGGTSIRTFIGDFLKTELDNYLHKNEAVAEALLNKIVQSEEERKALSGIQKLARERAKKAGLYNRKLRDCRIHYPDNNERRLETTLFITEGDSASGSITKARDPNIQGVFSLKGKPLNTYSLTKKIVYENEEFNLLQNALNIEESIENLRYNNVVISTDADVDGMHIRLLLLTFFLQFFPEVVKKNHLYILETPLFRVRNKKETIYCYSEIEKIQAIEKLGVKPEITRFKGLGEISPDEFKFFIGKDIRLQPVVLSPDKSIEELLSYYMGKNTPDRQEFIISNLKVEKEEPVGLDA
ncbi:MAG: type IIA DNA topoisomerase subunit B [Bacteroidia bacterium]|nr:type IIA DNA topoisomerase subunit B [Bacteroidia bacterium]